jgi:hypothetical protein
MIDDYPDPAEREVLREEEELVAELIGQYIARREAGAVVLLDELLARAAEFGARARTNLEDLIVCWELARLTS